MPSAPLRPCAGGCGARVTAGRCARCARQTEQRRGSASSRGYGAVWDAFRPQFIAQLIAAGIVPVCGAALPDGPRTQDSRCKAAGMLTFEGLHLDHDPPLRAHERCDVHAVCDARRIQLLCAVDHTAKTNRERGHQTRDV